MGEQTMVTNENDTVMQTSDEPIVLGPMVRYTSECEASMWVETRDAGEVAVITDGGRWSARTFGAHGHHYALVILDGLEPGQTYGYRVEVNGEQAWPLADSPFPDPFFKTLLHSRPEVSSST